MTDQSQERTRSQQQGDQQAQQQQQAEQQSQAQSQQPAKSDREQVIDVRHQLQEKAKSSFKAGKATVTLGRSGEHNLAVQWIDVNLANYQSARFDVKTAAQNALEVHVEQNFYKKSYSGSGVIGVPTLPAAPVGTAGKLIARDTTTGEILEVPWVWYDTGRGGPGLWATIKRLIWKSS